MIQAANLPAEPHPSEVALWPHSRYQQTRRDLCGGQRCDFVPNYIRRRRIAGRILVYACMLLFCFTVWACAISGAWRAGHAVVAKIGGR